MIKLTPQQILHMQAARANGASTVALAAEYGVSTATVSSHTHHQERRHCTPDELLISAFPWAERLTAAERAEFAQDLATHRHISQERDIDRLVLPWRHKAERRTA